MNVLILGANGFIGSNLSEAILADPKNDWHIYAMDMTQDKLEKCLGHERFHFTEGDITANKEWIAEHIKKCDVVLPLAAKQHTAEKPDLKPAIEFDISTTLESLYGPIKIKKIMPQKRHID